MATDDTVHCTCGHCGHEFDAVPQAKHRLLCGDSTNAADVARLMDGEKAALIVTSPPYNQNIETFRPSGMQRESPAFVDRMSNSYADSKPEHEYQAEQIALLEMLKSFMQPNGSIYYNHKHRYREKRVVSPMEWLSKVSYPVRQEIVWDRGSSITMNARMFIPAYERIYWLRVGDDFVFNDDVDIKSWSTVWNVAAVNEVKVSAAFAIEIPRRCIRASSKSGDIVMDPYSGSGTTIMAAVEQNRIGYGIELSPAYCDVIVTRWQNATGQTATRVPASMPVVPFEQVHPRDTWPSEPCEQCGEMTTVRPDHPAMMVPLCDVCRATTAEVA